MKIFREQTDLTQLNAPRNACRTKEQMGFAQPDGMCHTHLNAPDLLLLDDGPSHPRRIPPQGPPRWGKARQSSDFCSRSCWGVKLAWKQFLVGPSVTVCLAPTTQVLDNRSDTLK